MTVSLDLKVTQFFFDRAEVRRRVGYARRRALSRGGAYIRTRARTKVLRRRKAVSRPGHPPSIHSRDTRETLRNILFAYDPRADSVVVGPVAFNSRYGGYRTGIPVPSMLEFGGRGVIEEQAWRSDSQRRWFRRDRRRNKRPDLVYRSRRVQYRPRPFMSVALQDEVDAGTIPAAWRGAVRG